MAVFYDKLWKLLIDKKLNKTQMRLATGISPITLAKLSKGKLVTLEVVEKFVKNFIAILEIL